MKTLQRILPAIAALFSLVVFGLSANVLPSVQLRAAESFAVRPELLANVLALQFAAFIAASVSGGIAADRYGKKIVFLLACLCTGVGALACGMAPGLILFYGGAALLGMGGGILESMSSALLADLYPERRKLMLNISQIGYCLGAISGPILIGHWMPRGVSWRVFFGLLLGLSLALAILYGASRIPRTQREDVIDRRQFKALIGRSSFLGPCLIIFLYVFSETGTVTFINMFLRVHRAAPEQWAIYMISFFWTTMTVGRLICAVLPERLSYEKLIGLLMSAAGVTLLVHVATGHWIFHAVCFALTGFAFAGTWPFLVGLAVIRNPGFSGTVVGLTVAGGALGCVLAPPLVAVMFLNIPAGWAIALLSLPLFVGAALAIALSRMPSS